jgi:LuxR family transcriptional activator of conjugal transfer of Ti plasmids
MTEIFDKLVATPLPDQAILNHEVARASNLSLREVQCLAWVAEGKTDAEIGAILGVHTKTINYHVESVKRKFNVGTRMQAVVLAVRSGIIGWS